jgi:hypothetical protein
VAAARIKALETDAIVALAGGAANRREIPSFPILVLDEEDTVMRNAQSAIYQAVCLMKGWPLSEARTRVKLDAAMQKAMNEVYSRLVRANRCDCRATLRGNYTRGEASRKPRQD